MSELTTVLEIFRSCGVDTAEEQTLLNKRAEGMEHPVLLVAGDEPGCPLELLEGLGVGPVSPDGKPLPYPVQCGYGETFQLAATDSQGGQHHFYDIASFQAHCRADVVHLAVTVNAPVLRSAELRFVTVTEKTVSRLPELAGDCAGALLVLDRAAGAPEPAVGELCKWLKETAGLEEKVGLILNHAEPGTINWGLESMLDVEPIDTWTCWRQAELGTKKTPAGALAAAAQAVLYACPGGGADGMEALTARCIGLVREKLAAKTQALEARIKEKQEAARWFSDSSAKFKAKMQLAGGAMNFQLTPARRTELNADIKGMKEQLCRELPEMANEIVEANGRQAKNDLSNLAGDYVEALCNSYMEFITNYIAVTDVQPQAEKAFQNARDEFMLLVTSEDMPALARERTAYKDMDLLKTIQVNLGNFHDPIAETVSKLISLAVKFALWGRLGGLGRIVGDYLQPILEKAAVKVMPTKWVADHVIEDVQEQMDKVADMMFKTLDESVLPQLGAQVKADFQDNVDRNCALLEEQGDALRQEAEALLDERAVLAGKDQMLARMA